MELMLDWTLDKNLDCSGLGSGLPDCVRAPQEQTPFQGHSPSFAQKYNRGRTGDSPNGQLVVDYHWTGFGLAR